METIIRFVDYDCDGCGTVVQSLVKVNGKITQEEVREIQNLINQFKEEDGDWDFDSIVDDVCNEYFESKGIAYEFINIDFAVIL